MNEARQQVMKSPKSLIPGIPQDVVLDHILPRLPYYQRPVTKAVSKAWRAALHSPTDFISRSKDLLRNTGLVYFSHLLGAFAIQFLDISCGSWRALPPIPAGNIRDCICIHGSLYAVCSDWLGRRQIHKLDLSGGLWSWEKVTEISGDWEKVGVAYESDNKIIYLSGFGFLAEETLTWDKVSLRQARADNIYIISDGIYTLPSFVDGSYAEFYVLREGRYLEYHDMVVSGDEWKPIVVVDLLGRSALAADVVVVAACLGDRVCVIAVRGGAFSLWECVCPAQAREELDKFEWTKVCDLLPPPLPFRHNDPLLLLSACYSQLFLV